MRFDLKRSVEFRDAQLPCDGSRQLDDLVVAVMNAQAVEDVARNRAVFYDGPGVGERAFLLFIEEPALLEVR